VRGVLFRCSADVRTHPVCALDFRVRSAASWIKVESFGWPRRRHTGKSGATWQQINSCNIAMFFESSIIHKSCGTFEKFSF